MSYVITHSSRPGLLTGFNSNGGWKIEDVFCFSKLSWITFKTEKEAQNKITFIIKDCEQQRERWGDWTDIALKFAKKLNYSKRD